MYLVRLKKFEIYALADGMDEAYQKVRKMLDEKDYGFYGDCNLVGVDVVAKNWSKDGYVNLSDNKDIVV